MVGADEILSLAERTKRLDAEVSKLEDKGYEAIEETATVSILENDAGEQLHLEVDVFGQIIISTLVDDDIETDAAGDARTAPIPHPVDRYGLPMIIIGCALLAVVGSIGPWAKVWIATVSGTDGDGTITLALGLLAAALAGLLTTMPSRRGLLALGLFLSFGAIAAIGVDHWNDIHSLVTDEDDIAVSVGWGLQLVSIAGITGFIMTAVHYSRQPVRR